MSLTKFIGLLVMVTLFTSIVSAYHYAYSPTAYYPRSPYREQQNFFSNADITRQTADTNLANVRLSQDRFNEANNYRNFNQQLGAQGYFNSIFNSAQIDRGLSLSDGYNINKEPTTKRKIKVNNPGKKNDFTITEEVYDGISGNFFKDNRLTDSLKNNYNINQNNFGAQAYNTNNLNEGSLNRNIANLEGSLNTQTTTSKTLRATIGKGDLIIFN